MSWLAEAGGHPQLLEASCSPMSSEPARAGQVSPTLTCLGPPPCGIATEGSLLSRAHPVRSGPRLDDLGASPCLKLVTSHSCKVPFLCNAT